MPDSLLRVENLKKYYPIKGGVFGKRTGEVKAVNGLSFSLKKGETLGLVGESGCGKSTAGRTIMNLIEPTGGNVYFKDQDITKLSPKEMRSLRREMQMIFQDPFASLNPRHSVEKILLEPLVVHGIGSAKERREKVYEMLEMVGLSSYHAKRYPHQFSGGQRQRIGIARALMTRPKLIIADEPVSALDVSIQSQVLNLMQTLQKQFDLTYLFISHDLSVVRHISDRVGVMYLGNLIELADSERLYAEPQHPYTKALLSAVPIADPDVVKTQQEELIGDIPSASNLPNGCPFHTRCPVRVEMCKSIRPTLQENEKNHFVACHLTNLHNQ